MESFKRGFKKDREWTFYEAIKVESPAETLFGGFVYLGHQAMLFDKLGG